MAAGIRVLRPEGRTEGIDLGKRETVTLDVELSGYGQERFPTEEIRREIRSVLVVPGDVCEIQRTDPE